MEPKRCLGCGYILDHLPEPRCPECGRGFDANDQETYIERVVDGRAALWAALVAIGAILAAFAAEWVLSVVDPSGERESLRMWGHSAGIALAGLALVLELTVVVEVRRALRLPRHAVLHRAAVFAAVTIALLPIGGCLYLLAHR